MTATLLYADRPPFPVAASPAGDDASPVGADLWLAGDAFAAATGWTLTSEGLCRGDRCVRVPPGRERELVREGTRPGERELNVVALARLLEQPVLHDDRHGVWCIGEAAPARRESLQSLDAPDFTLPDLDGRAHALSDYRGLKVFLVSWASW